MMNAHPNNRTLRLAAVVLLAALLRAWAALTLPVDIDEPTYAAAALAYADALRSGDLAALIDMPANREHPPLVKLIYAGAALPLGEAATPTSLIFVGRAVSALAGALAVAAVGWRFGPLAALMLAAHTLAVKYTAQAYLEAIPLWLTVLALGLLGRPGSPGRPPAGARAELLSAAAIGAAAAAKLSYPILAAPALAWLMVAGRPGPWRRAARYLAVAGLAFYLLSPTLWRDPLGGLAAMAGFHFAYSQGAVVEAAAYPWHQPLAWLAGAPAAAWHPTVFLYPAPDGLILLCALAGLPLAWRDPGRRWQAIWLLAGLPALMLWPTRWPQYALTLVPAVCMLAAPPLGRLAARLRELDDYWGYAAQMLPRPPRYALAALALCLAFVGGVYAYGVAGVALGGVGWSRLGPEQHPALASPLYDALALGDGRLALAGERGLLIYRQEAPAPARWQLLSAGPALAIAEDADGMLWVGTRRGLLGYDPAGRPVAYQADLATGSPLVRALARSPDGRLWAGTGAGAAVRDRGGAWRALPEAAHGGLVLAIAPGPDAVWFGGLGVVSRLDLASGAWRHFGRESGLAGAGVADLLLDSSGRLWAASLGGGLGEWDGAAWRWHTPASSGLPQASVTALAEPAPGALWVGTSAAIAAEGGALTSYNGTAWRAYLPRNSGFSGAEPTAIAVDATGRLWVATRAGGVFCYQLP